MPEQRRKVLFVDDDVSFLDVAKDLMAAHAKDKWQIFTASDTAKALAIMQEAQIDLLLLDVHMPVVDGLQFLGLLKRKYPNALKVVLTGDTTESMRTACLSNGAELFLEKPSADEGWSGIYGALNALLQFQPEEGFRGVLRRVGLQDVLQMECLARHSLTLEVSTGTPQGTIVVQGGEIIHAEAGGRVGEEAFNYLMSLKGGEFSVKPFSEPPTRSISGSWEFLLMEAARKSDEAREAAGPLPDEDQSSPAAPAISSAVAMKEAAELVPTPAAIPALATNNLQPQIDEVLLCSVQGDVLYQWQCPDTNARIGFLEFVSQKARQLGQGLPVGNFERLEAENHDSRLVARIETDRALLVRASSAPTPASSA